MSSDGQRIDVARLLTIDVASELRKLTQAQLQGPWQLPAELVRRAVRAGARRVEVRLMRDGVTVEDDGEGLSPALLEQFGVLMDPSGEAASRHAALIGLERAGGLALLAIAGLEARAVRVVSSTCAGPKLLEVRGEQSVSLRDFAPPAPAGTRVELEGARIDRARAQAWLENVCRFAPVDVFVDTRPIPRGFTGSLGRRELVAPLAGAISIPGEGDDARAWLLQDGVVSTHVTLNPAPCFEAAIEMRGLAGADASAASLRDTLERHLDALLDQAVAHLVELGRNAATWPTPPRRRVTQLLLEASCQRRHVADIARLPLFRVVERAPSGELSNAWVDLVGMRASVEEDAGQRSIDALFPDQDPDAFALERRAFVLDEAERARLADLLALRFRQPRRRESVGAWGRHIAPVLQHVSDLGSTLAGKFWRKREIEEEALSEQERRGLHLLRDALDGQRGSGSPLRALAVCDGDGRVRRTGGVIWLPRDNPDVVACLEAVARDASWSYPALLFLLDGRALPSAQTRFAWTRARARG